MRMKELLKPITKEVKINYKIEIYPALVDKYFHTITMLLCMRLATKKN